ncbi:MAG: thioredoxin [Lentimicrobium sp.]|jgi:thioredoxin 1|nr:thioredoxin [Lentimicrobium sp.]
MSTSFENIIKSEKPVLIDFSADWCGPCKMLAPILKQVKDSLGDRITILKIDVDKNQALAAKYQVRGVPTMVLYQNGKQLWRQSGVLSKEEILKTILEKSN